MTNNGRPIRHKDVLVKSTEDDVGLGIAIDQRFLVLCRRHEDVTGNPLTFPESMNQDVLRWRKARCRHKTGDYRHTEAELRSMRAIAQWTVTKNEWLCGQPISAPMRWEKE